MARPSLLLPEKPPTPSLSAGGARPYAFADFLAMKPGTLIGGLMHIGDSWHLGPEWVFQKGDPWTVLPPGKISYLGYFLSEYSLKWRDNLHQYSRKISKSRLYTPRLELIDGSWRKLPNTMQIRLNVTSPVGIYLGHVLRCNGVYLVNILTMDGWDLWI